MLSAKGAGWGVSAGSPWRLLWGLGAQGQSRPGQRGCPRTKKEPDLPEPTPSACSQASAEPGKLLYKELVP